MNRADLSENDAREIERFTIYLRAVAQCRAAGMTTHEACHAVASDMYHGEFAEGPIKQDMNDGT